MEKIEIQDLSYWYPESDKPALKNINLKINQGEIALIIGPSGSGKSTLIRLLNRLVPDFYGGRIKGKVLIDNKNLREWNKKDIITNIGMVYQHPEKQIVMQDVEREIAFGLENLNMDINTMKRNVSESMSFLNLSGIKDRSTNEISGGEKQRIAIASVIAMNPDVLLFDEPVSQLDPIGAEEVLNFIKKLNRDMGKTIILIEHRLDKCFDMADRVIFMEDGTIIGEGNKSNIPSFIDKKYFLPCVSYIFRKAGYKDIPYNVRDARKIIESRNFKSISYANNKSENNVLEIKKLYFGYRKGDKNLNNINMNLGKGEILSVMGENGAGKSTLFKLVAGMMDSYSGIIKVYGKNLSSMGIRERIKVIGYLSQNPNDYLGRETVFEEVAYTLKNIGEYDENKVNSIMKEFDLTKLKNNNPRDLSGGEKQRVAIACTMVTNPDILILDEPTRGMDAEAKDNLGRIMKKLSGDGKSIVLITHDADFAADFSDSVMLMFDGEIIAKGSVDEILYDSIYYSPQISRVFSKKCNVVRTEDAINILRVM